MSNQVNLLPYALADLFAEVVSTGRITVADRYGIMAALLDNTLSEEEYSMVDRLLYGIRRGWLQVVNDISVVA
ncbi:MAG TPA: hypothetical protein V6D28_02785 [Leptolyngbyaceae cyanobacterium]